jgi:hypothetical protein
MTAAAPIYPKRWPRCPYCGEPALDGHITCGSLFCSEAAAQRAHVGDDLGFMNYLRTPLDVVRALAPDLVHAAEAAHA